jgi:hypothetical protein
MGLLDRFRAAAALVGEAYDTVPRWAMITNIGNRMGPLLSIEMEVHYGNDAPHILSTWVSAPKGVDPQIGQHVTIRKMRTDGYHQTDFDIVWNEPPHYGRDAVRGALPGGQATVPDAVANPGSGGQVAGRIHPLQQLAQAKKAYDEGRITQEELDQAIHAIEQWKRGHGLAES